MASSSDVVSLLEEDQKPHRLILASSSTQSLAKAVPGLARLVENLCVADVDDRHQRLRLGNATLRERILDPLPGAMDVLCYLGYSLQEENGEAVLILDATKHNTEAAKMELSWLWQLIEDRWQPQNWNCLTCTLLNKGQLVKCDACGEPRPSSALPPSVPKPVPLKAATSDGKSQPKIRARQQEREQILAEARADRQRFVQNPSVACGSTEPAQPAQPVSVPAAAAPAVVASLRVRLPDGSVMQESFGSASPLLLVFEHIDCILAANGDLGEYSLLQAIPRRVFIREVLGARSLAELGLAPSATLSVLRSEDRGRVQSGGVETALLTGDIDGLSYEEMLELESRMGYAGQARRPTKRARDAQTRVHKYRIGHSGDTRCSICLCDFEPDDELRTLWCGHAFHRTCVDTWLAAKDDCPVCRDGMS
mmetsp:Transcript_12902/g.22835  ORF Transcript_12902/g.22835 Transcript_12902/m.22835 type:complete len:423 (-) Transcript_12902:11-1279(-)